MTKGVVFIIVGFILLIIGRADESIILSRAIKARKRDSDSA